MDESNIEQLEVINKTLSTLIKQEKERQAVRKEYEPVNGGVIRGGERLEAGRTESKRYENHRY